MTQSRTTRELNPAIGGTLSGTSIAGIVEYTPFLQANKVYWYLSIPVSGAIMAAYSLATLYGLLRHPFAGPRAEAKQQEII